MKLFFPLRGIGRTPGVYLTQHFGGHAADYSQYGWIGHNGIDWGAPLGTPVYAVTDGWIVEAVAKDTGYGLRISQYFEADGFQWIAIYAHFQKINYPDIKYVNWNLQNRTNFVKAGQIIGYVDSTGNSTGNHLHMTLAKYQNYVLLNPNNGYGGAIDPLPYLKGEPQMTNSYLIQVNKKNGSKEFAVAMPAVDGDALIDKALNTGLYIPTVGGSVDWANLKPTFIVNE